MRIAICDESEMERVTLETFIVRCFRETSIRCECVLYDSIMNLYCDISHGVDYEIVILDVYFSEKPLGMLVAERLREINYRGEILFCASSKEHILESFDVFAAGYLMKPVSYEKLRKFLERIRTGFLSTRYVIWQRSKQIYIPINDIMYFESANTKCHIQCINQKRYTIYKQLRQVEMELRDGRFLRCHQSFLVNMNYIEEAKDVFVLVDGTEILIKQREKRKMHAQLREYLGQRGVLIRTPDYEY